MKTGKKILSVLLSVIMIVSTMSVSFSAFTVFAVDGNDLESAFSAVTDINDLTNGDGTLLNAAEVLYNYVYSIAKTDCNGISGNGWQGVGVAAIDNNSSANLNSSAKAAVPGYDSLIDALIPTTGVTDDAWAYGVQNQRYSVGIGWGGTASFDWNRVWYGVNSDAILSSTVTADLEKLLLKYETLSDVPESILTKAVYTYRNTLRRDSRMDQWDEGNWFNKKRWFAWSSLSWQTLDQKPIRTATYDNETYVNLHAFADYFTNERLATTVRQLIELSAEEISATILANNAALAYLDSYSENVKNHFFDMTKVKEYMDNCLFAQKVINAKPAIESLGNAMNAGYDVNDLSAMNSIYTAQKPNLEFVKNVSSDVIDYVKENFEGFSEFTVENAEKFMTQLDKDIQLYKIREIKTAVDALRTQYPDAESIRGIDDNQLLWNYYDLIKGYNNTLETAFNLDYVAEVFTEGTGYVKSFETELKFEWDYREAEDQYDSFWSWFLPLVYADLTKVKTEDIIGSGIAEGIPNIKNAVSKKSAFEKMYEKYLALIGEDAMKAIFGDGENALGYIIDDYIERLYATILARLDSEVSTAVGYYDAYGEVNLSNFAAIKDAVGKVERNIWTFINDNNSSIISEKLRSDYNRLDSLLNMYNSFVQSGGLNNFEQKHRHNSDGVYMVRDVTDEDLARTSGEEYAVTEKTVNDTIKKLDKFLTSADFTNVADIDADNLSDYIKEVLADNLYTDDFVNMIMSVLYPQLTKALEDLYASLPKEVWYDAGLWKDKIKIGYKSLPELITGLGMGLYPNQVAGYIDGFDSVRNQLYAAGGSWNNLTKDGKFTLDWGIDSIKPENYSSTEQFIEAKKTRFMNAMSESFDAILPVVRVLFGDWGGYNATVNKAGYGEYIGIKLNADLNLTASGCAGYSDLVTPILEALGCDNIPSYDTVKGYTTSKQFVNAIFNPLIDFVENELAKKPVETLCSVLPNLAYAVPMDKLWERFQYLNIRLNYKANDSILNIQVVNDHYDLRLSDFVNKNSLGLDFDVSSFSSIISYVVGMFVKDVDSSTLPVMNSGELITYASLDKNASTKRRNGNRINFTADKADVFMAVLDYLTRCLGSDDFVNKLYKQFSKDDEMTPELKTIIQNIYTSIGDENGNMALAAIIELLNQTEYALKGYEWVQASSAVGTVEGVTPASKVYLSYNNDWTKKAADYVGNNLDSIVSAALETAGSDIDLSKSITDAINGLFTNKTVTGAAKGLASIIDLPQKITDLIKTELGVDLTEYYKYRDIDESYDWGFTDGDRDGFSKAFLKVLEPLEPLFGFLFKGEEVHIFKNSADLVLFGNEGYDAALVPLLEALGCDVKSAAGFEAEDTAKVVLETVFERLDELEKDPINTIAELLPGVVYYLSSNAFSVGIRNLLHPIYVIIDTIRPVYAVDLQALADALSTPDGLENLNASYFVSKIEELTGLKLTGLATLCEDVSKVIATKYDSKSNFLTKNDNAYKGAYIDGTFDRGDMVTVVISYLLDILKDEDNAKVIDSLLKTENFTAALLAVFNGTDPESKKINWMYYFGEDADLTKYDFEKGVQIYPTVEALNYPNNWTAGAAGYINENLDEIVASLLKAAGETGTLSELLKSKINLYTGENLQKINDTIVSLLKDVDETLVGAASVVLGIDLDAIKSYTAPAGTLSGEEFADELTKILEPVNGLVNWLLFSKDYKFFTGTEKDADGNYVYNDVITVKGADGYANGLAVVLEALGCENLPSKDDKDALNKALKSLFARVDEILADPVNEVLDVLPNVIYFLNADGLTASVYNTLSAVYALSSSLEKLGAKLDLNELLGFDLSDLSFEKLMTVAGEKSGIDLSAVSAIFGELCIGTIKQYLSVSGEYAYKMQYTEKETRRDMLTLLVTALVETVKLDGNEEKLRELLGNDTYDAVLGVLKLRQFEMQKPSYIGTEYADTDKTFSAIESSVLFSGYKYGPLYTKEMAQYIADNFDGFLDNLVYLLGIEINGNNVESFEDLLNSLVNGSLYNSKNIRAIADKILEFTSKIDAMDGGEHIKALIKESLGVDLDFWKTYTVADFDDDRAAFTNALCKVVSPLYPVLEWLLTGKDFTFFVDEEGKDLVTLIGADGYAYGIIPLLEALDCKNVLTPEEYCSAAKADKNAMVTGITKSLFDRIDEIMKNPADEILSMLPQVIYFVNSNGLDTCFKNVLHSVYGILNAIEPLVKVDLYELIGIRLDEATFESLFELAVSKIEEQTGQKLDGIKLDTFLELTVGKLVSYTSKNGEKAYKMVYQSNAAKAEMVTIVERLAITFLMNKDNRTKVLTILKEKCNMSADAEKYVKATLDLLATYTGTHFGMDQSLFAIYQIFRGANKGTGDAASSIQGVNAKWKEILKMLNGSDDPNAQGLGSLIGKILDENLGGIFDSNGLASQGFIVFWKNLIALFQKILSFFKNLIGR